MGLAEIWGELERLEELIRIALTRSSAGATATPWTFVAAAASPVQATAGESLAVDLRTGPVVVTAPSSPTNGEVFAIKDWYNLSAVGSPGAGQPGGPIVITSAGPPLEDPSNPGVYATTVHVADPGGFVGTWIFSSAANAWGLR